MPAPFRPRPLPSSGLKTIYDPFKGIDWSMSIHRPGCQDHLLYPSRRCDQRVLHQGPIGMRSAAKEYHRDDR